MNYIVTIRVPCTIIIRLDLFMFVFLRSYCNLLVCSIIFLFCAMSCTYIIQWTLHYPRSNNRPTYKKRRSTFINSEWRFSCSKYPQNHIALERFYSDLKSHGGLNPSNFDLVQVCRSLVKPLTETLVSSAPSPWCVTPRKAQWWLSLQT